MFDIKDIENKIINADCIDILKQLPDKCIDLVLTDPPYLIKGNGFNSKAGFLKDRKIFDDLIEIKDGFDLSVLSEICRIMKKWNCYIYCNKDLLFELILWFKENEPDVFLDVLVEEITNPTPFCNNTYLNNIDYILFIRESGVKINGSIKDKTKIRTKSTNKEDKEKYKHPTPKYVELVGNYIKNSSDENALVLDCFSGSGTTAIACHRLKRRFICIEKDKDYWQASVKRLEDEQAQWVLF